MSSDWPFADPPNVATITVRQITDRTTWIHYVSHDANDGGWQFLSRDNFSMEDALVVALSTIVAVDPSVCSLS
ncbi:MAG: hypothetical protein AAF085_03270, partial [Planctomycetota bacterium]